MQVWSHLFAGAKIVSAAARDYGGACCYIPRFDYAVDWGYFWFLTRPIFLAIDWLNSVAGEFRAGHHGRSPSA